MSNVKSYFEGLISSTMVTNYHHQTTCVLFFFLFHFQECTCVIIKKIKQTVSLYTSNPSAWYIIQSKLLNFSNICLIRLKLRSLTLFFLAQPFVEEEFPQTISNAYTMHCTTYIFTTYFFFSFFFKKKLNCFVDVC